MYARITEALEARLPLTLSPRVTGGGRDGEVTKTLSHPQENVFTAALSVTFTEYVAV